MPKRPGGVNGEAPALPQSSPHLPSDNDPVRARVITQFASRYSAIDESLAGETDDAVIKALRRKRGALDRAVGKAIAEARIVARARLAVVPPPDDDVPPPDDEWQGGGQGDNRLHAMWSPGDLARTADEMIGLLNSRGTDVFARANAVVEVDDNAIIHEMSVTRIRDVLSRLVVFSVPGEGPITIPEVLARTIIDRHGKGFRPLDAVIRCPTLRRDGTILEAPGYDVGTGLYYRPAGTQFKPFHQKPTAKQAQAALKALLEPLEDFPFILEAHRMAAVAHIMTCVLRNAVDGPIPGFAFDAPASGTGKTNCAKIGGAVAMGTDPGVTKYPREDDEQEKRITTFLRAGLPIVIFDNIRYPFGSETTDMLLTSRVHKGRILSASELADYPNNTIWSFTGNNLKLNNVDSMRRLVWVRMAYQGGNPSERSGFKIDDIENWPIQNRTRLIRAAITVARFNQVSPIENRPRRFNSYDGWSRLIREAILNVSGVDPLDGFPADDPELHTESTHFATFYLEWMRSIVSAPDDARWTIVDLMKVDALRDIATQICPGDADRRNQRFGEKLKEFKGRAFPIRDYDGVDLGQFRCVNLLDRGQKPVKTKTGIAISLEQYAGGETWNPVTKWTVPQLSDPVW
jgi:hypothetical protein